jgi:hypothetical protein
MSEEIRKIQSKLEASRAKLLATVDGLQAQAWEWRPADGRWSARLTLAHVGSAQWSHLEVAQRLVAGKPTAIPGFDLDEWNNTRVAEREDWSVDQVLADLEAAQQATIEFLEALDDETLLITGTHPALGEVSVAQVIRIIPIHDNLHRRDLLKLVRGRPVEG